MGLGHSTRRPRYERDSDPYHLPTTSSCSCPAIEGLLEGSVKRQPEVKKHGLRDPRGLSLGAPLVKARSGFTRFRDVFYDILVFIYFSV